MIIDIEHFGSERRIDGPFRIKISKEDAHILIAHLQTALSNWPDDWLEISDNQDIPIDQRPDINQVPNVPPITKPESQYFVYGNRHKPIEQMNHYELAEYMKWRAHVGLSGRIF